MKSVMETFELLETLWSAPAREGLVLNCSVYLTGAGYDVRIEDAAGGLVRTQWARDVDAARLIADRWLVALQEGEL